MQGVSRARLAWGIFAIIVLVVSALGVTLAVSARPSSAVGSPSVASTAGASGAVGAVSAGGLAGTVTGVVSTRASVAATGSGSPTTCCPA